MTPLLLMCSLILYHKKKKKSTRLSEQGRLGRKCKQNAKTVKHGSSCHASSETNLTSIHENTGLIADLPQWIKDLGVAMSCGVGCRRRSDLALLWL